MARERKFATDPTKPHALAIAHDHLAGVVRLMRLWRNLCAQSSMKGGEANAETPAGASMAQ
jgi:hypothetical protein